MQKKLLALAVAGALVPAAAMAQSTVEIYGRANLGFDSWEADGATLDTGNLDRRNRIYDGSSRVGFRVNEALGGGMRAFVVIETGVNIDTGSLAGQSGDANTSSGNWASRDSYVGLGGGWGDVRFGRQSVWWSNGVIAQTGANYINTAADSLINDPGLLAIPSARTSNVVSYNSPTFGGFNATLAYSPTGGIGGGNTEGSGFTGAAGQEKSSLFGFTGRYTSGALRAQFDWAVNNNLAFVDGRDNTGMKLGVGWAYAPGSQISGIIGQLENENIAAIASVGVPAGIDLKQRFFLVNWEHMLGQIQLLAQLYKSNDVQADGDDVDDSGATGVTLAAKYFLSKRTGVYASFSTARNDDFSWADMSGGGISSAGGGGLAPTSAGADVKIIAVGVMHNF